MRRLSLAIVMAVTAVALPTSVWAEPVTSGQGTVNVGPVGSGPVVSNGTASFGPPGTGASASSHSSVPSGPANGAVETSGPGSGVIYKPIPNNAVPVAGAPWVDQFGVIHVAPALPASACPPGQTGYYAYDAAGAITGTVCVGNPANAPAGAPAPSPLALAQQASASQPWPDLQVSMNPAL